MDRKDYIRLLASSPLPKSAIDKDTQEVTPPEFISNYEQAVLNGFKGSQDYFEKKYKIHDKLYAEVGNITKAIEILKLEQNTTNASTIGEVKQDIEIIQNSILEITDNIDKEKELVNKRINDTNDKIDKRTKQTEAKIIDLYPQINNLQSDIKETKDIISDYKSDILQKNKEISKKLKDSNKILIDEIIKNNKEKEIKLLEKKLEDKADFTEVEEALKSFYTKKEVDKKIDSIEKVQKNYTYVSGGNSGGSSGPSYTPFVLITNAERLALSPSAGWIVYCTDSPEGLYIYTNGDRLLLTGGTSPRPSTSNIITTDGDTIVTTDLDTIVYI